eukprot:Tamp_30140.p1 GENE.Tamp_30140~~Tamp_30140.p1  ORF type:complete len:161 (-),score=24.13 Tamp_30140:3-485(-)
MLLACRCEGTGATACPRRPHMLARVRTDRHATAEGLQSIIVSSVHSLYGDVGLPGEVDVLQVLKDKTAVLRVPFHKQRELWSALTLVSDVDGDACTIQVVQTSPFLLSLACSSRAHAGRAVGRPSNTAGGKGPSRTGDLPGDEGFLLDDMVDPWQQYFDS